MPLSTFIITFALNEQRGALRCGLRSYPTNLMRLVPPKDCDGIIFILPCSHSHSATFFVPYYFI